MEGKVCGKSNRSFLTTTSIFKEFMIRMNYFSVKTISQAEIQTTCCVLIENSGIAALETFNSLHNCQPGSAVCKSC